MLPSVKLKLRTDKKNSKGLCPIFIEAYYHKKRVNKSTGIYIEEIHWKEKEVSELHPFHKKLNRALRSKVSELENKYKAQAEHGDIQLKVETKESKFTFIHYGRLLLQRQKKKLGEKTLEKYNIKLDIMQKFDNDTRIGKINYAWLEKLEEWLRRDKGGNTVCDYFKLVRKICRNAHKKGILNPYPFDDYPFPEYKDPEIVYLVKEELEKIEKYLAESNEVDTLYIISAYFLLECYSGMRHSDWAKFNLEKLIDGEAIKVSTTKTGAPVYLFLENSPKLQYIVQLITEKKLKYDFVLETANDELKVLARVCKIPKRISTHVGRHTFGVMCAELGISKETLAQLLGISTKVADVYFKVTRQKVRAEFSAWKKF